MPQTRVLRTVFKAAALIEIRDRNRKPGETAYQLMNAVEARGIDDPQRVIDTMEVVVKIFNGTQGHVTPRDLNVMLRSAGLLSHTLSDDGIYSMSALLWDEKKARGE